MSEQSKALNDFVESVRRVCAEEPAGEARWRRAADEMRQLLANEALQEHASTWPAGQGRELILHHDEEFGFFVGALVRVPQHKAGAHDHAHTFTVYGVLNGEELTSLFERVDDGSQPGKAQIRKTDRHSDSRWHGGHRWAVGDPRGEQRRGAFRRYHAAQRDSRQLRPERVRRGDRHGSLPSRVATHPVPDRVTARPNYRADALSARAGATV